MKQRLFLCRRTLVVSSQIKDPSTCKPDSDMPSDGKLDINRILRSYSASANKYFINSINLASSGEIALALENVKDAQNTALKAKKLIAAALRKKLIPSTRAINMCLGSVEDARLYALAATTGTKSFAYLANYGKDKSTEKRLHSGVLSNFVAAIKLLGSVQLGECPIECYQKLKTAQANITKISDDATKMNAEYIIYHEEINSIISALSARLRHLAEAEIKMGKTNKGPSVTLPNI